MFRVLVRSFLNCFILSVFLIGGVIGLVGYSLFSIGREGLRESRSVSEARGRELAAALAQMAGENEGAENYRVKMSSVMHEIVRRSREENAGFQVDEVFLLGVSGNVIAHSDVAKMAENADVDYTDKYYRDTLARPEEQPFAIDRIDEETFSHGVLYEQLDEGAPQLARKLRSIFPERVTTRYRISRAVYSVDQRVPSGGIHMTVTNTTINAYVNMLKSYTLKSLGLGLALVIFITTLMFFLISITFRKYARLNALNTHAAASGTHQSNPEHLADGSAVPLSQFDEELPDLEPEDV
ncbi:MAG: hypothetical protein KDK34_01150, partial [Leptospiraceae bacterium]|nr:hypothetical protein [Leptospiraceae bacterium]